MLSSKGTTQPLTFMVVISSALATTPEAIDFRAGTMPAELKGTLSRAFGTAEVKRSDGYRVYLRGLDIRFNGEVIGRVREGTLQEVNDASSDDAITLYRASRTAERPVVGLRTPLPDQFVVDATQNGVAAIHIEVERVGKDSCGC